MSKTSPEQNKKIVLKAFDALFNKRDYAAAAEFWSEHYIQHSSHIEPGRDGLFNLVKSLPPTLRYENSLIMAGAITSSSTEDFPEMEPRRSDRGGYRQDGRRPPGRALGRPAKRSDSSRIQEWTTYVRRRVSVMKRRPHDRWRATNLLVRLGAWADTTTQMVFWFGADQAGRNRSRG